MDRSGPTARTTLGGSGFQERTGPDKDKLERRSQEGPTENGTHLERGRGSSPQQTRMMSDCGTMRPYGCKLNLGQGQGHQSQDHMSVPDRQG